LTLGLLVQICYSPFGRQSSWG